MESLSNFVASIQALFTEAFQGFVSTMSGIWDALRSFWEKAIDGIQKGIGTITLTLQGFINPLVQIAQWFAGLPDRILTLAVNFGKGIIEGFSAVAETIYNLPFVKPVVDFFTNLPEHIINFAKGAVNFFTNLPNMFKPVIDFFVSIPEHLKNVFDIIINAALGFKDWVLNSVVPTVVGGLEAIGGAVLGAFKGLFNFLMEGLKEAGIAVWSVAEGILGGICGFVQKISTGTPAFIPPLLIALITPVVGVAASSYISNAKEAIGAALVHDTTSALKTSIMFPASILTGALAAQVASTILHVLADNLDIQIRLSALLRPFGIGAGGWLDKPISLKGTLHWLASLTWKLPKRMIDYSILGVMYWITEPYGILIKSSMRNVLPVKIPSESKLIELVQRHTPHKAFKDYLDTLKWALRLSGYSEKFVEAFSKLYTEEYVVIKDRFGIERKFPTSLIYELPTPSQLASMMVHDLFYPHPENPEKLATAEFEKAMQMRGMNP
ncbi:MAG: hypothetical protein DRN81_06975, partial [Thermoproteota archaeon]